MRNDHMIVQRNTKCPGEVGEFASGPQVGGAGLRVAGRVVVDENYPGGATFERSKQDLAIVEFHRVCGAGGDFFEANQAIFLIDVERDQCLAGPIAEQQLEEGGEIVSYGDERSVIKWLLERGKHERARGVQHVRGVRPGAAV